MKTPILSTTYFKNKFNNSKQNNQYKDLKLKQTSESFRQEKQLNEYLTVPLTRHD